MPDRAVPISRLSQGISNASHSSTLVSIGLAHRPAGLHEAEVVFDLAEQFCEILSCLSTQERKDFAKLLGKIEDNLGLVQASRPMSEADAY